MRRARRHGAAGVQNEIDRFVRRDRKRRQRRQHFHAGSARRRGTGNRRPRSASVPRIFQFREIEGPRTGRCRQRERESRKPLERDRTCSGRQRYIEKRRVGLRAVCAFKRNGAVAPVERRNTGVAGRHRDLNGTGGSGRWHLDRAAEPADRGKRRCSRRRNRRKRIVRLELGAVACRTRKSGRAWRGCSGRNNSGRLRRSSASSAARCKTANGGKQQSRDGQTRKRSSHPISLSCSALAVQSAG